MITGNDIATKPPTDLLEEAKHAAGKVAHTATEQIEHRLDSEKNKAVEAIGGVADALRQTSERRTTPGPAAALAGRAADGIDDVADYLQSRSLGEVVGEVERFARREPAIFLGAAFTLGLIGGRFLKSSAGRKREAAGRSEVASADRDQAMNHGYRLPQGSRDGGDRSRPVVSGAEDRNSAAGSRGMGASAPSTQPNPASSPARTPSSAAPGTEWNRASSAGPSMESSNNGSIGMDASNIGSTRTDPKTPSAMPAPGAQPEGAKSAASDSPSGAVGVTSNEPNDRKGSDRKVTPGVRGKS